VTVNATFPTPHRTLAAAAAALVIAIVLGALAPPLAGDVATMFGDGAASTAATEQRSAVPPATWAHDPLASPLRLLTRP
jgi:hypothetical protein